MMSAPSLTSEAASASRSSRVAKRPASENDSGLEFPTPMTSVEATSSTRPAMRSVGATLALYGPSSVAAGCGRQTGVLPHGSPGLSDLARGRRREPPSWRRVARQRSRRPPSPGVWASMPRPSTGISPRGRLRRRRLRPRPGPAPRHDHGGRALDDHSPREHVLAFMRPVRVAADAGEASNASALRLPGRRPRHPAQRPHARPSA